MKLVLLGIILSLAVQSGLGAIANNVNEDSERPNVNLLGSDETLNNFLTFQQWKSFKEKHGMRFIQYPFASNHEGPTGVWGCKGGEINLFICQK